MGEGDFDTGVKLEDLPRKEDVQELRDFVRRNKIPSGRRVFVENLLVGLRMVQVAYRIHMPNKVEDGDEISQDVFVSEERNNPSRDALSRHIIAGEWPKLEDGKPASVAVVEEKKMSGLNDYSNKREDVVRPATLHDVQKALKELREALKD